MNLLRIRVNKNPKAALSIILQLSLLLVSISYALLYPPKALAYSTAFIRLDRQYALARLSGTVCMKPTAATQGETKVIIAFPSTFALPDANSTWTVDTNANNLPNTANGDALTGTAWPGIVGGPTVVDNATKAAIFATTQLTSTSLLYCFHFVGGSSTTVGAAGNDESGNFSTWKIGTGGGIIENPQYAVSIVTATNGEQIQVTATVSASFTFQLSTGAGAGATAAASLPLGVLGTSAVVTTPYRVTATINTNGQNGFLSWMKGGGLGLHSNTTGQDLPYVPYNSGNPTTLVAGSTTGYGAFAVPVTNAPTIATMYNTPDAGTAVGNISSAGFALVASKTGTQTGTQFNIGVRAVPSTSIAPASDYTDVLTVVAAGSF